jgi:hypothetical protein
MLMLFRVVIDRLKSLFAGAAVAELQAELLTREAERRAELYRLADQYEAEDLPLVADGLRRQVPALIPTDLLPAPIPVLPPASGGQHTGSNGRRKSR